MTAELLMPSSKICAARFATPRTDRATLGPKVAEMARLMGKPLMPWQRQVADVALEVRPDGSPAYRRVVLTVPRQSGKTTLLLALFVHRALAWPSGQPQVMTYAAQTGVDARKKFVDEQMPMLRKTPLKSRFRTRLTNGHEAILWSNGSRHGIGASTEKSGHGAVLHLAVVDEAFAQEDARLEQALSPAMVTRPDAQLWVVSTAGTSSSTYLRAKVEAGRESFADTDGGVAYFEWSADPADDPEDPEVWWRCMPALGITTTEDVIRAELNGFLSAPDGLSEFRRAYLNQWVDRDAADTLTVAQWEALPRGAQPKDPVVFGIDAAPGHRSASVVATDGTDVELVDHRPGAAWLLPRLVELNEKHKPSGFAYDPAGPIAALEPELTQAGIPLTPVKGPDSVRALAFLVGSVRDSTIRHDGSPEFAAAVAGAGRRHVGDGHKWSRRDSSVDISPLVAATVALWVANAEAGPAEPGVWFI